MSISPRGSRFSLCLAAFLFLAEAAAALPIPFPRFVVPYRAGKGTRVVEVYGEPESRVTVHFGVSYGAPWLTVEASCQDREYLVPRSGRVKVRLKYRYAANPSALERMGVVWIEGAPANRDGIQIYQPGVPCRASLGPGATSRLSAAGGPVVLPVRAPAGCSWSAEFNRDWLAVSAPEGTGDGEIEGYLYPNTGAKVRSGRLRLLSHGRGGRARSWTLRQSGGGANGTVAPPVFEPEPGTYPSALKVTLKAAPPDATIVYTTDGSDPDRENGTLYEPGTLIDVPGSVVLRAFAYREGWSDSAASQGTYDVSASPVLEPYTDPSTGMEFVWVPAGAYEMGDTFGECPSEECAGNAAVHRVTITEGFYLGRYEVTQSQWESVTGSDPWYFLYPALRECGAGCPAFGVSWDDAESFAEELSRRTGRRFRLPTEAEWEYAASFGATKSKYPGPSDPAALGDYAWYAANSQATPHPVGQKLPNALGAYDLSGNVREWVQDWFAPYGSAPEYDPAGPVLTQWGRGLRGGGWMSPAEDLRAAGRGADAPIFSNPDVGFRLVLEP